MHALMPAPGATLGLDVGRAVVADIAPHPLTDEGRETRVLALPRETTVAALVREQLGPGPQDLEVVLDGQVLPAERWAATRLHDGALVTIHPGAHGRRVLSLITIAASIFVPQLLGLSGLTSALVSGAIKVVGGIVTNALFPVRTPDVGGAPAKPDPVYSLTGGANTARLYEPLALVLGTHRLFPDLGAKEYTEFVDGNQFLHQIFHAGLGDLMLTDYRIGETAIAEFTDVDIQVKHGGTITNVAGNVDTAMGAALDDDQFVVRSTGDDTTRIGIDITARLFELNDRGGTDARSVTLQIQYEKPGTAAVTESETLTHDKQSPLRRTFAYDLPEAGTWTVRVRRTSTPSDDDRIYDEVVWASLRSYQPDPADYTGQTRIGMRIQASGQLTGRLERFSVLASQRVPVFQPPQDGADPQWTSDHHRSSNPAAVFRWYARGVAIDGSTRAGIGLPAARIDDAVLGAWYQWCDTQGLACDTVLRGGATHDDTLTLIAQCGRAALSWATGKLGVVYEDAAREPTGLVTPGNLVKGSFRVEYAQGAAADEVVVRYLEPDLDWQYNSVRRTRPGLNGPPQTTATISARGIVVRANAARECNLQVARQHYHRRRLLWEMGREGRSLRKGQVVWITHSLIDGGFAGRVAALESATRVKLDRAVNLTADDHLLLRLADGTLHQSAVSRPADVPATGEVNTVALSTALPAAALGKGEALDVIWRLYDQALPPVKARIVAVEPRSERRFKFTAIDEVAAYHTLATSDLTAPFPMRPSRQPHVVGVQFVSERIRAGSGYVIQLDALLTVAGDWRGAVVRAGPDANTLALVDRLVDGDTIARWLVPPDTDQFVQIVPGTEAAQAGPVWTGTWSREGVPAPPPVTGFAITHLADGHRSYAFTPPAVPDFAGVAIRYASAANAAWAAMTPAHEGLLTASPYESVRPAAAGTYTFEARAVNTAGVESTGVRVTTTLPVVTGGLNWTGPWNATRTYARHDVVAHDGSSWVSLRDGNLNQEPAEGSTWWDLLVRQGTDGLPGARGLAGYAHRITRATRAGAFGDVDSASEWHLTGITGQWTGTRTLRLGIVSADERALLERIAAGALVTVFDDADNWADYRLVSVAFNASAPLNARLSLTHLEHVGAQPWSGAIAFHFTPAGADGVPGNRGLAGYSDRIRRTTKRASAAAADQANEWYLSGAATSWSGNRTFALGGITEDEETLLRGLRAGALVTLYQGTDGWADYTLRSAVTFAGTEASRRASLSLAYVESVGAQDATAAVELHFTRAGADGLPGHRGLAGYSDRIQRTHKRTSAAAAGQADEWFLTGAADTWTGNRTFTMGGLTEAEETLLGGIAQGALVTLYQGTDAWADYTLRSPVAFAGAGASRRATVSLAYVESVGAQDATAAVELHFTRAGADGLPGHRGLAGYSDRIQRTHKRTSAAAAGQADEWFLTGAADTWTGNRTFTMGGLTEAEETLLGGIAQGALVTLYQGTDAWADYTLRSPVAFAGAGASRRATVSLAYVESVGAQDATAAVEFHFTRAGADGLPGNRGLAGYSNQIRRTTKGTSATDASQPNEWFLTGAADAWTGARTFTLGGLTEAEEALLERLGDGALVTLYQTVGGWADYTLNGLPRFVGSGANRRADLSLVYVESVGAQDPAAAVDFHFTAAGVPAPRLGLTLFQDDNNRGLYIGGASGAVLAYTDLAGDLGDFSSLIILGLGQTRMGWAALSQEVPMQLLPAHDADIPGGHDWWVQGDGQTWLRLQFASARNAADETIVYVNRASATRLNWRRVHADVQFRVVQVIGIAGGKAPGTQVGSSVVTETNAGSSRIEYAYIRASSAPSAPAGGTSTYQHAPTGWTFSTSATSPLTPTATENVYRVQRLASFTSATKSSSTFDSATAWAGVTKVADATGPTTQDRTEYIYIQAASAPSTATSNFGAPAGWTFSTSSASPLQPTATLNVYRRRRVATYNTGGFTSGNFVSATPWGFQTRVASATGYPVPGLPTGLSATLSGSGPWTVTFSWDPPGNAVAAGVTGYEYYRLAAGKTQVNLKSTSGTSATFNIPNPPNSPGVIVTYRVRAVGPGGMSAYALTTLLNPG